MYKRHFNINRKKYCVHLSFKLKEKGDKNVDKFHEKVHVPVKIHTIHFKKKRANIKYICQKKLCLNKSTFVTTLSHGSAYPFQKAVKQLFEMRRLGS